MLRRLCLAPLVRAGKELHQVGPKVPSALLNTTVEIVEGAIYYRPLPIAEPQLDRTQPANRPQRGTEMRLTEDMDALRRALIRGRDACLAPFDVRGAFDKVPRRHLMQGLANMGIDAHARRVTHNWLAMGTSQVKTAPPKGTCFGDIYDVARGPPNRGSPTPSFLVCGREGEGGEGERSDGGGGMA